MRGPAGVRWTGPQPGTVVNEHWCRVLTRIGDLPGMNHVGTARGQSALGRSPEAAHTFTVVKPAGKVRTGSASDGSIASTASTT